MTEGRLNSLFAMLLAIAPLQAAEAPAAPSDEAAAVSGIPAPASMAQALENRSARLDFSAQPKVSPYREHAPLAYFSLGSLVMAGVFYGIQSSLDYPGGASVSGDGTKVGMAIGAAGITALAAAASYLYYANRGDKQARSWAGKVSGGVAPDGTMAASVTLPIASLSSFSSLSD